MGAGVAGGMRNMLDTAVKRESLMVWISTDWPVSRGNAVLTVDAVPGVFP